MNDGNLDIQFEQDAVVLKLADRLKSALFSRRGNKSQFVKRLTKETARDLISDLRLACSPHLGSVGNEDSYRWNHRGTNTTLHEFSELTVSALLHILRTRDIYQKREGKSQRLRFFQSLKQNYGTTALCMSGGAANGYFHLGMVKALLHYGMLPNIITGSSAGSLIGACIASKTDQELEEFLDQDSSIICKFFQPVEGSLFSWFWRWAKTGAAVDPSSWYDKLNVLMNGLWTFKEAYIRTGRDLFICVFDGSDQTRVLNWRTTPDVLIASAVIASSALPHIMHGQQLRVKKRDGTIIPLNDGTNSYFDGSLKHDIPLEHLNKHFSQLNVRYTIVSQVEPHILPFFYYPKGSPGDPEIARRGHGLRGGFVLSLAERFLKLDIRKYLSLVRDLGLTPNAVQDFDDAFLQKTWGDVTIRPNVEIADYLHVFSNPTNVSMKNKIKRGELATYPYLCMISHRHKIEQCLKNCCREAANAVMTTVDGNISRMKLNDENDVSGGGGDGNDDGNDDGNLLPSSLSLSSSLSLLAEERSNNNSLKTLSVHESRQLERERDQANALLEQEKSRCEYLQRSWDEEKLQRMKMEADVDGISTMMEEDTYHLRQRSQSSHKRRISVGGVISRNNSRNSNNSNNIYPQ
jgi:predicted acylesterase/phospholipase RssA